MIGDIYRICFGVGYYNCWKIIEGAVLGHSNEDRQRIIDRISELFMDSGYEHHIIKLEQVIFYLSINTNPSSISF